MKFQMKMVRHAFSLGDKTLRFKDFRFTHKGDFSLSHAGSRQD
jgi:hypothetical protein